MYVNIIYLTNSKIGLAVNNKKIKYICMSSVDKLTKHNIILDWVS